MSKIAKVSLTPDETKLIIQEKTVFDQTKLNCIKTGSFMLLLAVLAACAPASQGGSLYSAFDLSQEGTFNITAGNTWYFSQSYPASYFDLDLGDVPDKAFDSGRVGTAYTTATTKHFKISTTGLPDSWSVKLQSAKGTQTLTDVTKTNRRTSLKWYETVELHFAVMVPQNALPDRYTGLVTVTSDENEVSVLPFLLRVSAQTAGN